MAESFGADAAGYDRARPSYPDALIRRIIDENHGADESRGADSNRAADSIHGADSAGGPSILDGGCGTGIEARQFQAAGCRVLGVDPDERMADFARRSGVEVEVARFEEWDARGRSFDAVVAGQAWHWVHPIAGAAKAAGVLRPGGLLAVFAHVFQPPPAIAQAQSDAFRRIAPDSPINRQSAGNGGQPRTALQTYQLMFDSFADGMRQATGLGEPAQWRFDWNQTYTCSQWLELLPTTGALTQLPHDQLTEVLDAVGAAIDEAGGSFTMPYVTLAAVARRADTPDLIAAAS
jgi:SAM-dependent methyltransferase